MSSSTDNRIPITIAGIYDDGVPGDKISMVIPLAEAQTLIGRPGQINVIAITNTGNAIDGAAHTDEVLAKLEPALAGNRTYRRGTEAGGSG